MCTSRRYVGESLVLESVWETRTGTVKITDFMPQRDATPDVMRIVECVSGSVEMNSTLRLRFDYGSVVPWVRRADGHRVAVAGPDSVWLRSEPEVKTWGQQFSTVSSFVVGEGEKVAFVLTWHPSHQPRPDLVDPFEALEHSLQDWADWSSRCRYEGPVPRCRHPLPHHPQGTHVRARPAASSRPPPPRSRRNSAASGTGTTASAGCATRRSRWAPCSRRATRRRPGPGATGCCARWPGTPPICRSCTDSPGSAGCRRRSCRGWPDTRAPARTHRQRRRGPAAARRLRRGHRLPLPGTRDRPVVGGARLESAAEPARLPGVEVARAGRGAVGSTRPAPPLRALQGDGVGGGGPCRTHAGGESRAARGRGPVAHDARRGAPGGVREGIRPGAQHLHAVLRLHASSTPRRC